MVSSPGEADRTLVRRTYLQEEWFSFCTPGRCITCTGGKSREASESETFPLTKSWGSVTAPVLFTGVEKCLQISSVPSTVLESTRLESKSCSNTCLLYDLGLAFKLSQPQSPYLENGDNNNPLGVMVRLARGNSSVSSAPSSACYSVMF